MLPLWTSITRHIVPLKSRFRPYPLIRSPLFSWTPRNGLSSTSVPLKSTRALPPRPMWLIKEEEIEEKFIKGGGPGGQKVNKCNSKAQITHVPTGIVVDSQYSRSQNKNRIRAREILAMKLEQMADPDNCRLGVIADRKAKLKANRAKKAARKYHQQEKREKRAEEKVQRHEEFLRLNGGKKNNKKVEIQPILDIDHEIDQLLGGSQGTPDEKGNGRVGSENDSSK